MILFVFLAAINKVYAQQLNLGCTSGVGFIIAHSFENAHLAKSHPVYNEVNLQNQTTGKKDWNHYYNMPTINHNFSRIKYGNPILGSTYAYTIQFGYPLLRKGNFNLATNIGTGVGVSTKKFDRKNNYKNNVIGSRITGSMHGRLLANHQITPNIKLDYGIAIIHFSNGAFTLPNWGINVPYAFIGLNYGLNKVEIETREHRSLHLGQDNPFRCAFQIANGLKDIYPSAGKKNWYNTMSGRAFWSANKIYRLTSGLDLFVDRSVNEYRSVVGLSTDKNYALKLGWVVGQEIIIGKVEFSTEYGRYLYQAYFTTYANAYQRYQIKYFITENIYTSMAMKLHKGAADVLELSIGFAL